MSPKPLHTLNTIARQKFHPNRSALLWSDHDRERAMITLVLAMAENGVIGKEGTIPWRIADDLKRFKTLTVGKTVVMGRKTWDSLPRKPLPGRKNVVVTRNVGWHAPGAVPATLPGDVFHITGKDDLMVIGGAEIYNLFLPRADRIELTQVHHAFDGDARFEFDKSGWHEIAREDHATPDGLAYSYVTLTRK
jgi:dihydrofolate reductase